MSATLGLPVMLSSEDIDQELPLAIDDEYITDDGVLPLPSNYKSLMSGSNALTGLGLVMSKVLKYIYPVQDTNRRSDRTYQVCHSRIRELEQDLQAWLDALPEHFKPGTEATPHVER